MDALRQVLPLIVRRHDDYDESEADAFYVFYQPFDNADGSGAYGGTTEDATSGGRPFVQIVDSVLKGTTTGSNDGTGGSNGVSSTLTTPCGSAVVRFDFKKLAPVEGSRLFIYIEDSISAKIAIFEIYAGAEGSIRIRIKDKDIDTVAEIWSSAVLSPVSGALEIEINLTTKTAAVYSDEWDFANNEGILLNSGTPMNSTNISKVDIVFYSADGVASMVDAQVDALTVSLL